MKGEEGVLVNVGEEMEDWDVGRYNLFNGI